MFYDLPNALVIVLIVLVSYRFALIPSWLALSLGLMAFTPFFLNDVLFPTSYMPDQYKYFDIVEALRDFSLVYTPYSRAVESSSWMLAFIPIPFVETVSSLGFSNRLIVTILTIWLYASKKIRGWPLLFLVFYPSLVMYSSLALRDTLILLFMIVSMIFFIENKRILAIAFAVPLFFIKFQNFFLMLVFFTIYIVYSREFILFKIRNFLIPLVVVMSLPFIMLIIKEIDFYRRAMFIEDGGLAVQYTPISGFGDFIALAMSSSPYLLLKPFPWEAASLMQVIQSFENILIFGFMFFLFFSAFKIDKIIAYKWLIFLFVATAIYGLVVFNFGTAARYKFPFIIMVVVGMAYEIYRRCDVVLMKRFYK